MRVRAAVLVAFAALGLGVAWYGGGSDGLLGMALGLVATSFNNLALWGGVRLVGVTAPLGGQGRFGAFLAITAFLIKLPIFVALGLYAQSVSSVAAACFLGGLAMVYFATVGLALARR